MSTNKKIVTNYIKQFQYYKMLADKAIAQLRPGQLYEVSNTGSNSIAIIMKHIAGNMVSRWTDIFNTDGEKPWRNRDNEFEVNEMTYEMLNEYWEKGWQTLYNTLSDLTDKDLDEIIYIRNMGHTVREAIIRQLCHYPYHIGQIVYVAKYIVGDDFKSLSIPKGASVAYNTDKFCKEKSKKHFTDDL